MSASASSRSSGWFASPPPPAALEISARRLHAVAIAAQRDTRSLAGQVTEPLPEGLVTPSLNGTNVHDVAALGGAIRAAVERLSPRPSRAALILPDVVAKVSLLRFDKIPAKPQDLEQLVRWQIRKSVPFRIEDAQVSWVEGIALDGGGRELLVLAARRDIVESYERACAEADVHAGLVDIASTNLVNAVLATDPAAAAVPAAIPGATRQGATGDWLLVHTSPEFATLVIVRDGRVIFYRHRPSDEAPHDIGDLVHQTAMYFEDRLGGGGFARVILAGGSSWGANAERVRQQIEERVSTRVEPLDVRRGLGFRDRIAAGPDLLDAIAPAVGALLRDRPARGGRAGEEVA